MCLIITIIMFGLAIQNFIDSNWLTGMLELSVSFGFIFLLLRNIEQVRCEKTGKCNHFILKLFKKDTEK